MSSLGSPGCEGGEDATELRRIDCYSVRASSHTVNMTKTQLELFEQQQHSISSEYRRELGLHGVAKLRQTLATTNRHQQNVARHT